MTKHVNIQKEIKKYSNPKANNVSRKAITKQNITPHKNVTMPDLIMAGADQKGKASQKNKDVLQNVHGGITLLHKTKVKKMQILILTIGEYQDNNTKYSDPTSDTEGKKMKQNK